MLKHFRKTQGLSQQALAKAAGIHQVTLSRIETGESAGRLSTLRSLAKTLGITVIELLGEGGPAPKQDEN